jgi:hypothetical protein
MRRWAVCRRYHNMVLIGAAIRIRHWFKSGLFKQDAL